MMVYVGNYQTPTIDRSMDGWMDGLTDWIGSVWIRHKIPIQSSVEIPESSHHPIIPESSQMISMNHLRIPSSHPFFLPPDPRFPGRSRLIGKGLDAFAGHDPRGEPLDRITVVTIETIETIE